jgi:hypothetical protein
VKARADIFKRKCPRCLKAVPFRAREERAGGTLRITTVACTSCEVVIGVLPQMSQFPDKRDLSMIVRGVVKTHVNAAVRRLKQRRLRAKP